MPWGGHEMPVSPTPVILCSAAFSKIFLFYISIEPMSNAVTVSHEPRWRDSAIQIHISILPQTLLPSRVPQNIEQSSMCSIVSPCWSSILNNSVTFLIMWHKDVWSPNMLTTLRHSAQKHLFLWCSMEKLMHSLRDFVLFSSMMLSWDFLQGYIWLCVFALQANYKIHVPRKIGSHWTTDWSFSNCKWWPIGRRWDHFCGWFWIKELE